MFNRLTPVVLNLIILNALVFLVVNVMHPEWIDWMALWKTNLIFDRPYGGGVQQFRPYQIVSHFFTHGSLMHIGFNMFALASIGSMIEMVLGSRRFLEFYLFTGIVSGIMVALFDPSFNPVVGASGAISGVLVAFAFYFPRQKLQIMFIPVGIPARNFAWGLAGISLFFVVLDYLHISDGGGVSHFGHLAGMGAAVLYAFVNKLLNRFNNGPQNPWR
ncbi:MAG: rhomboid family intramembrane serine protease [Bacteroidia bacterium]|nr:rhomboid family intramembrane serine protease [Bacteroidia bacterium]